MHATDNPFVGPPPPEVPLSRAPLERVIIQVRFPPVVSIEQQNFIAGFQEAIRTEYPVLRPIQTKSVVVANFRIDATSPIWRFFDESGAWWVSLAANFISLETSSYTSRLDFLGRFHRLLTALNTHVSPTTFDRIGVRYIDRVKGHNLASLRQLVRQEVAGVLGGSFEASLSHSICDSLFTADEGYQVRTRWGQLSPGTTIDPTAVDPITEKSWVLDIDAFSTVQGRFEVDTLIATARALAERIYSIFRWAVTDEFLQRYGGSR